MKASESNINIHYHGLVDNKTMLKKLSESDIVINPRMTMDEVCNFTFPSKLIEYMLCGAAVLTTKINSIPKEYYNFLYFIEDESPRGIADSILQVLNIPDEEKFIKYKMGRDFLYENQTWQRVIDRIDTFMASI